jgi:hypothetical protein
MPQPERNTSGLAHAAERRSAQALDRVRSAIRRLQRDGNLISFQAVAREAGVSRQFLYTTTELRTQIEQLRYEQTNGRAVAVPSAQRTSDASLKARNQMLLDENRRLRDEVKELREELAQAWGDLRALQREHRSNGAGELSR